MLLKDLIEGVFRSTWVVTFQLIFIAILMQVAEAYAKRRGFRPREDFNAKDAWIIGVGPVHRADSRLVAQRLDDHDRALPPRAARLRGAVLVRDEHPGDHRRGRVSAVRCEATSWRRSARRRSWSRIVVAFISGWASIWFLLRYLRTHTTHVFIYYRYVLGAVLAVLLLTGYVK